MMRIMMKIVEIHLMILTDGERSEGEVSDSLIKRAVPLIGLSNRLDVALLAAEPTEDANDDAESPKADAKEGSFEILCDSRIFCCLSLSCFI